MLLKKEIENQFLLIDKFSNKNFWESFFLQLRNRKEKVRLQDKF